MTEPAGPPTGPSTAPAVPIAVRLAGAGVVVEGLLALTFAVDLAATHTAPFATWGFFVLLGLAVAGVGVALVRGVRGARGPAVVVQLLLLGLAYYAAFPSRRPEWGVPAALVAVLVLVALLSRPGREWSAGSPDGA